jgi:hypothetical protein
MKLTIDDLPMVKASARDGCGYDLMMALSRLA